MTERATKKELGWVLLFLLIMDLILLAPALFREDRVRAPGDEIVASMPFIREAESPVPQPANAYLSDWSYSIHSWQRLVREAYRDGRLPLWNEKAGCGQPLVGNLQAEIFSPFQPLNLVAGDQYVDWKQFAQLLVAQLSCLFLVVVLKSSGFAALILTIGFSFGSYMQTWAVHPVAGSAAFAPAVLATLLLLRRGFSYTRLSAAGLVIGLSVLAGHIESTFMAAFAACGVAFLSGNGEPGFGAALLARLRFAGLALASGTLGLALSAAILLPFADYFDQSPVSTMRQAQGAVVVPAEHLLTLLDPKAFGFPTEGEGFHGFLNYITTTFHVGHVVLIAALVGMGLGLFDRRRHVLPLILLVLFGIGVSHLNAETQSKLSFFPFNLMPLLRMHFLASMLLPVLAAIGVDALLAQKSTGRAVFVFVVALAATLAGPVALSIGDFDYAPEIHATSLALLAAGGLLLAFLVFRAEGRTRAITLAALALVMAGEALWIWRPFIPTVPTSYLSPESPSLAWLERESAEARVLPLVPNLPPETASLFDIHSLRSYDGMGMTRLTALLWHLQAYQGVVVDAPIVHVPRGVLDALGVRWTLSDCDPVDLVGLYTEVFVEAGSRGQRSIPSTLKGAEIEFLIFRPDGGEIPPGAVEIGFTHASGARISRRFPNDDGAFPRDDIIGRFHAEEDHALRGYMKRAERRQKSRHHYLAMEMATTGESLELEMNVAEDAPPMVVRVLGRDSWNAQSRFENAGIHVGERESCPPPIHSSAAQLVVEDTTSAIHTLARPDVDVKKTTILECEADFLAGVAPRQAIEAIDFVRVSPEEFRFETDFDAPRIVVIQEMPARGWTARGNDELLPLVPANVASMAIRVPAGKQTVVVRYRSEALAWGLVISGFAFLLVFAAPFVDRLLEKSEKTNRAEPTSINSETTPGG